MRQNHLAGVTGKTAIDEVTNTIVSAENEGNNPGKVSSAWGSAKGLAASLEAESRAKAEALRIKKKLESDINELEIALEQFFKSRHNILNATDHDHVSFLRQLCEDMKRQHHVFFFCVNQTRGHNRINNLKYVNMVTSLDENRL